MESEVLKRNIRGARLRQGMTQTEVAERLFVTPQTVSKWEQGTALPDLENLCNLAFVLQTTPDRLLGIGTDEETVYLGIDAGGTKTDMVLFRDNGTVLRRKKFPGANPNACGIETATEILLRGIEEIAAGRALGGIFAGIAGSTVANNKTLLTAAMKRRFPGVPLWVESDIANVIGSVRNADACVAVICGTGSVIFLWNGTELRRIGGYGYLFDGAGSGFDLGRDVLTACLEAEDGLRPETELTVLTRNRLGGAAWDALDRLYSGGKEVIASFAQIAFEASRKGDEIATELLQKNFDRIIRLIRFAQASCPSNTVLCAGSIADQPEFQTALKNAGIDPTIPQLPPIFGACAICAKRCNTKTPEPVFDRNFQQTLPK